MTKYNGTRRFPNISKINTKILAKIVDDSGRTDLGTDYGPLLEEIRDELHRRQETQASKALNSMERQLQQEDTHINGKQCPKCKKRYPVQTIEVNFYKVANRPNRYRPRCKACHIEASKTARTKEIPF